MVISDKVYALVLQPIAISPEDLAIESSVEGIVADNAYTITMEGGKILVNGQVADVYNFAGTVKTGNG